MDKAHPKIAVVIPAYNVEATIEKVILGIPKSVASIIVVNDASRDDTASKVKNVKDNRVILISHTKNMGVGGAMLSGYSYALSLGVDIIVKLDGDDQMDVKFMPALVDPIMNAQADYTKGNRFLHPVALKKMPFGRKISNLGLTFLSKIASGYWNIFDPANGYTAISASKLASLDPTKIARSYFFETSMLCELRKLDAVVMDISMPAIYQNERSSVKVPREILIFSTNLFGRIFDRFFSRYFLYDFTAVSLYIIIGTLLCLFGAIWGLIKWNEAAQARVPATTGTVLIAVLPIILGFQLLIQAFTLDISDIPTKVQANRMITDDLMSSYIHELVKKGDAIHA
ncbi:MAG: glycosyl transferase family 2 [Chloroflexi bacterium HGW-Chloroflexi-4]|jgi:glycosyltransferase involved in cell wall biosynthesis|nr:MAG: glycosyl transferase family 2 [Chloroflexi bacterium HGW-Chloroflexi-4]